jgi:divalent metal cation (Fe/Co/Zn/Cd) transporter
MPLLLLVTAILFVFVMVSQYVQKVRLNIARTESDYFHLVMALLMALAGVLAIRGMLRERRIRRVKSSSEKTTAMPHERSFPETVVSAATLVRVGFARRPWVMTLVSILILSIPIALWAMATRRNWNEFTHIDWILVGVAEVPMFLVAAVAVFARGKSRSQ